MCGLLTVRFNHGHSLYPFHELIYNHNNMVMPPGQSLVSIHEIKPHLVKGLVVIIGCNGVGCERILHANTYQGWHFLTALAQSLKIDGQK